MLTNAFFKTRTDGKELSNSSMVGRSSETEFTVSLWGFPSGLTQPYGQGIYTINGSFYNNNDPGGIFRIYILPGGGVKVQTGAGGVGGELILANADSPIQMNTWFHLMLVLENNTLNIFVNGQDKTSLATVTGTISTMPSLLTGAYKNYMLGYFNSTTYSWQGSMVDLATWDSDKSSDISTIYNNGQPGDLTSLSPKNWWKLTDGSLVDSGSEADNAVALSTLPTVVATNVNSNSTSNASSGMTEANLIDDNVSTVNAESDTLPGTALVQSDLTRKLPFSNYSINLDGTNHFDLGTNPSLDIFGADFSVSLWFKTTDTATASGLFQIGGFTKNFAITKGNDVGNIGFVVNTNTWFYNIGSGLNDGDWHNVIVVNSNNNYTVYIDSVSYDSFSSGSYNTGSHNSIGKGHNNSFYFDGYLSNIAVYNRAISNEEALDLYNNGVTQDLNNSFTPGQPYFWWPLDAKYTYFDGTDLVVREIVSGSDGNGQNTEQHDIVGNAPGSTANGIGSNLTIADLKGDMKNSTNNSYSINMADYADGVTNPASSGRSTIIP